MALTATTHCHFAIVMVPHALLCSAAAADTTEPVIGPSGDSETDATSDSSAAQPTLHEPDVSTEESRRIEPPRHEADTSTSDQNEPGLHEAVGSTTFQEAEDAVKESQGESLY